MTPRLKPGAFHLTRGCEWAGLRRIYCEAPKSGEIPGCVEIGESGVATVQTAQLGWTLAVGLFAVATLAAGATRVPRIDRDDPHALNLGFVLDEGPQLEEAPAALSIALRPPNRGPRANTLQVFQGNPARRVLGGRNDLLADAMILDATKPAFAAREGLQSFPRTSRAGLLQGSAIPLMASADAFDRRAGVGRAVTIGGEVHDPEVDAEPDMRVCGESDTAAGGLDRIRREQPDVAVVDLSLGLDLTKAIWRSPRCPWAPDLAAASCHTARACHDGSPPGATSRRAAARGSGRR